VTRRKLMLTVVNRSSRNVLVMVFSALGAAAGCGGGHPLLAPDGGPSSGHGGAVGVGIDARGEGRSPCRGLDEATCGATRGCTAGTCSCNGKTSFEVCFPTGETAPPCNRPPCDTRPCDTLDETACMTRDDCKAESCPDCDGGQRFGLCAGPNEAVACLGCQAPAPCAAVTTLAGCDARADCHSVFVDHPICDCAVAGCCASFARCADGGQAACKGTPLCMVATPYCEAPAFVVSYTANCYEGCVPPTECAP